jgi:peptidyl-prolyl cis-trans isomerase D
VAKIGSEVRVEQFRQLYQDRLQQPRSHHAILPDQARALGLDRQLLAQLIAETVADERAQALRLGISDAEIARQITENPNFKGITGQFDRAQFDQVLRNNGYTEARFLDEQRRTALRQQLVGTLSAEAPVPKIALESFNRFQHEERTIEYVVLGPSQAGENRADAGGADAFRGAVVFRAPEYRKYAGRADARGPRIRIEVSDADLKGLRERHARFDTPGSVTSSRSCLRT